MLKYDNILNAKQLYAQGENITSFLKSEYSLADNNSQIIEIAYDLQAGSYIQNMNNNLNDITKIIDEMLVYLNPYLEGCESILDIGTGEMTTLSLLISRAKFVPKRIFALDISWSRLHRGVDYFKNNCPTEYFQSLNVFVADMKMIPLLSKSVDLIISSHALEPNGKTEDLEKILSELFRVARKKLVLFEPSYELNSVEGRKRMERLGYIKNLKGSVERLGGKVDGVDLMNLNVNPLNPTACYVISPPNYQSDENTVPLIESDSYYSAPASDFLLKEVDNFLFSPELSLAYPILKGIPVLKSNSSILATAIQAN